MPLKTGCVYSIEEFELSTTQPTERVKRRSPPMQCESSTADGDCNTEQRLNAIYPASLFCDEARVWMREQDCDCGGCNTEQRGGRSLLAPLFCDEARIGCRKGR
ncbi:hypothetical protein PMIN03_005812 [Paraphaeosphaeria minitans]